MAQQLGNFGSGNNSRHSLQTLSCNDCDFGLNNANGISGAVNHDGTAFRRIKFAHGIVLVLYVPFTAEGLKLLYSVTRLRTI